MAALLGSYVAGERAANRIFAQTFHRSDKADDDQTFYFDNTATTDALEPELLFVITSSYTSGAAEWLIRALRNVLGEANVYVVGQTTNGQIVITEEIHSDYYVTINPAVAFVAGFLMATAVAVAVASVVLAVSFMMRSFSIPTIMIASVVLLFLVESLPF